MCEETFKTALRDLLALAGTCSLRAAYEAAVQEFNRQFGIRGESEPPSLGELWLFGMFFLKLAKEHAPGKFVVVRERTCKRSTPGQCSNALFVLDCLQICLSRVLQLASTLRWLLDLKINPGPMSLVWGRRALANKLSEPEAGIGEAVQQ